MKKCILLFVLLGAVKLLTAQAPCPAYWEDITAFKKKDSATPPPEHAILFIGSSSFTRWTDVSEYFPGYTIINRGFGGSTLVDVIRYAYDIILPYKPKQVVIYCGENDLASSDEVTVAEVVRRFKTLYAIIRQNLPTTQVDFVSMKPSPSRAYLMPKYRIANAQIKAYLQSQKRSGFINIYSAMLDDKGQPRAALFLEDQLHMQPAGYKIWQRIIRPYLLK
jgi:lysophospholipase L1-like esterase